MCAGIFTNCRRCPSSSKLYIIGNLFSLLPVLCSQLSARSAIIDTLKNATVVAIGVTDCSEVNARQKVEVDASNGDLSKAPKTFRLKRPCSKPNYFGKNWTRIIRPIEAYVWSESLIDCLYNKMYVVCQWDRNV